MKVKTKIKPHREETVVIQTDFIRLDAFLKFKGLAETGGHAKLLIQDGYVRLNGEICTARGKKIKPGDTISMRGCTYKIIHES